MVLPQPLRPCPPSITVLTLTQGLPWVPPSGFGASFVSSQVRCSGQDGLRLLVPRPLTFLTCGFQNSCLEGLGSEQPGHLPNPHPFLRVWQAEDQLKAGTLSTAEPQGAA